MILLNGLSVDSPQLDWLQNIQIRRIVRRDIYAIPEILLR